MYVCMYVCMYVYVYMYVCMCVYVCMYVCVYVCVYVYVCMCVYVFIYMYVFLYVCVCMYVYIKYECMYVCLYVCMYLRICLYIYIHIHTQTAAVTISPFPFLGIKIGSWNADDGLLRRRKSNKPLQFYKYSFKREHFAVKIFSFTIILCLLLFLCWASVTVNILMLHIT